MALSNRARASSAFRRAGIREATLSPGGVNDPSEFTRDKRASWARLLRKIFEADPLLCSCGATMKIVSLITEPTVSANSTVRNQLFGVGSDHPSLPPPSRSELPCHQDSACVWC